MKLLNLKIAGIAITSAMVALFCWCNNLPTDPTTVSNTTFKVVFKSPTLTRLDASSFVDTLGTRIRIGIATNLTNHIDSASLKLVSVNSTTDTIVDIHDFTALQTVDTVWFYYALRDTGKITMYAKVFVHDWNTLADTVTLTVHARVNHAPRLLVSGKTTIEAGAACSLSFGASDPDAGQKMRYSIDSKPDSALFDTINNFFKWIPGVVDTGVRSFVFRVVDDGFPPMADSLRYDITVTPGVGNRAPVWQHDTITENIQPGSVFTKTLSALCADPDGETLQFTLLGGAPQLDTIIAGTYVFTPQTKDTGIVFPKIVATDPSGAADTVVLRLNISTLPPPDQQRPSLKLLSPVDSAVVNSNSVQVKVKCFDDSGIKWVKCSMGTDTFAIASATNDSIYTSTVTGLKQGVYNTITITAADASAGQNKDTLRLRVKYDSTATDNIPPVVRLISPANDTVIAADSCRIQLMCKDAGGVGSVAGLIGQTNFVGQKVPGNDSLWQLTVKGLTGGQYTTVLIIATDASTGKNRDTISVKIKYDIDSKRPDIVLLDPPKDSVIISANAYTIKVRCSDASGIATLHCTMGTTTFPTTNSSDSIWSVNVTGLLQNQYNKITLIATDSSLKANKDTLSLYIKYDPTLDDNVKPTITLLSTLPSTMIVADSILSITDSIYDASGIDSVYWTLNGKNLRMLSSVKTTATGGTYLLTDTLRRYHLDTIDVYAIDKSTARNPGTQRIILNYNVPPVAKDTSVSTLLNTAKAIALTATSNDGDPLTWSALGDPAHGTVGSTGATFTYTPATDWVGADSFYVKVTDGVWSDTAKVKVTTTDTRIAPKNVAIVVQPSSGTVMVGQALSMSVTMNADVTPAPTYQWFKNNVAIGTASTISITAAAPADEGTYKVTVTNGAGSASSSAVTVTVLPTYTLTVNKTATGGTVALLKDTVVYPAGASVRLTAAPANGYRFVNWTGDTTVTANPLTVIMRKDRVITANYKRQYMLTLTSSDATKGSVSSTAGSSPFAVDSGTAINITAAPVSGYKLKQWSTTAAGVVFSSTTALSATVTLNQANATVRGEFGCVTFKKQLNFNQYADMVLTDAVQTSDGGYLVVGRTSSIAGTLIIRLNQQGDTVLTHVDTWIEECTSIRLVPGGYLASGRSSGSAVAYCFAQNGNSLWGVSHAILGKNLFAVVTMATKDGGCIMGAGDGDGMYHMIKSDALHSGVWDTMYSASVGSMFDCIPARDGGYIFVGGSTYDMQPYAIKTNSAGEMVWSATFTSALQGYTPTTRFYSVDTTTDGGFIFAGSGSFNSVPQGFILKVATGGTYGNGININDASTIKSIRVTKNGEYMIAGGTLTAGSGGGEDIYITRTSSTGTVLHSSTYGSTGDQSAKSLQLTSDGGAIVTGIGNWIIKTDENGGTD